MQINPVSLLVAAAALAQVASGLSYRSPADGAVIAGLKGAAGSRASAKAGKSVTPTAAGTQSTGGAGGKSTKVIAVVVGSTNINKSLAFTPHEISATPGQIVQFQFSMINHTVTQSAFDTPCQPISATNESAIGVNSGFVPAAAGESTVKTFTMVINNTEPMFIYCAQGPHCQLGMVMTINAKNDGNQTFAAYKAAAAKASKNVPASAVRGGKMGTIPAASAAPPPV